MSYPVMALEALIRVAPTLSKYHGKRGFEVERFIVDYTAWMAYRMLAVEREPEKDLRTRALQLRDGNPYYEETAPTRGAALDSLATPVSDQLREAWGRFGHRGVEGKVGAVRGGKWSR
jgi:hypothetical protein